MKLLYDFAFLEDETTSEALKLKHETCKDIYYWRNGRDKGRTKDGIYTYTHPLSEELIRSYWFLKCNTRWQVAVNMNQQMSYIDRMESYTV